jgi:uncharacterized phosphatase
MKPTLLYLLRHGETAWNRDGNRYAGRTDVPLSDRGSEQARAVAATLAPVPFSAIYCSTLQRSRETAEIIASAHNLPIIADPRLIEINFGTWEGLTRAEIQTNDAATWTAWRTDPETAAAGTTGETGRAAADRFTAFVEHLVAHHPGETVFAVGHNTLNRLFLADALGMPLRHYPRLMQDNAGLTIVEIGNEGVVVQRMNVGCGL